MNILQPDRNCSNPYRVSSAELLIDGRAYYRAFFRTILRASRFILMAGWRFDSEVALLRGEEAENAQAPVHLLSLLKQLCERTPYLSVFVLAWDFNVLYSLDREWFQKWQFDWQSPRIFFRFDGRHPLGASHHQKFAVVDGTSAFLGGMDLCARCWDDRDHLPENPLRVDPDDRPYEAHHDVQAHLEGPAAGYLTELFVHRWRLAGGESLDQLLREGKNRREETDNSYRPEPTNPEYFPRGKSDGEALPGEIPLHPAPVSFSVTMPGTPPGFNDPVRQIQHLYRDAIGGARRFVYLENQYFSSRIIYNAFLQRFRDPGKPRLQVVVILPKEPHTLLETVALINREADTLRGLKKEALRYGHRIGVYHTSSGKGKNRIPVYIHSKLLLVDHRFLTVGSANLADRSMGLDTELNVSWEGNPDNCLRRVATELLVEHTGRDRDEAEEAFEPGRDVVSFMDECASDENCRLHVLTEEVLFSNRKAFRKLLPPDFAIDPDGPVLEGGLYEAFSGSGEEYARGVSSLFAELNRRRHSE